MVGKLDRIVIVDGARTPIGSFGGIFAGVPAHILGAAAVRGALTRSEVGPDEPGEVVMGCIGQVWPDAYNARRVAIEAGLPTSTPAYTVNRLCGSGLQAIWSAAMEMRWNGLDLAIGGGDESMSRMPFYDFGARDGKKLGDRTLVDGTVAMLTDPFGNVHMGRTAEAVARKYGVSREEQDDFALESQRRAATPEAKAAFAEEIVPFEVGGRKAFIASTDEHPKPDTTMEILAGLRPAFEKDGSVTAGNASGINDGAAAVVLARESVARDRGRTGLKGRRQRSGRDRQQPGPSVQHTRNGTGWTTRSSRNHTSKLAGCSMIGVCGLRRLCWPIIGTWGRVNHGPIGPRGIDPVVISSILIGGSTKHP